MATDAPEPSAIRRPSASARCVIISATSRLTLAVARSPRSWSTGRASSARPTDTLAFATATTLWNYSASRPRPQSGRLRRAEQSAASRCRRFRASPTLRSPDAAAISDQRASPTKPRCNAARLSSAACGNGPLFTAASACSNSCGRRHADQDRAHRLVRDREAHRGLRQAAGVALLHQRHQPPRTLQVRIVGLADPIGSGGGLAIGCRSATPLSAPPASTRIPTTPTPAACVWSNILP